MRKNVGVIAEKACKVTFTVYPDYITFKIYSSMYISK